MKKRRENTIPGDIEKKIVDSDDSKISPLETTAQAHNSKKEVEEIKDVIEGLISELEPNKIYEKIERKLKTRELDEKEAKDHGFKPDNYYTAKEKEDEENELERNIEGSSGTMSGMGRSR